jgi:hypothetical protein
MSWGSYASITIPKKYLTPEVLESIRDCVSNEDDEPDNKTVQFWSDTASNGQFEDLEAELIELGIPFNRFTGQDFDRDPATRYFRPATDGKQEIDVTVLEHREYGEFIPISDIKRILNLKPKVFKAFILRIMEEWAPSIPPLSQWA